MKFETRPQSVFEDAFNYPEALPSGGEIVDLAPDNPKSEIPVIVVPGWVADAEIHKENSIELAKRGRRTLGISATHGIKNNREFEDLPLAEARKAESVLDALHSKNISRADIVTHSEGAIFVTAAALEEPEKFRSLILNSPAGLIGDDGFWKLASRFGEDQGVQTKNAFQGKGAFSKIGRIISKAGKAVLRNPKASLEEVKAIASVQIEENLKELRKKGVKIIIIHPVNDRAFPMARIQEMLKKGTVDGFVSTGSNPESAQLSDTHNAWVLSPEKYAGAVDSVLDAIDKKETAGGTVQK